MKLLYIFPLTLLLCITACAEKNDAKPKSKYPSTEIEVQCNQYYQGKLIIIPDCDKYK